jgi:cytochrome c oxidase cbb3-type subunit 3
MSDFLHDGWSIYIAIITLVSLVACAVFLRALSTRKLAPGEKVGVTGHAWDGDLQEWNNPLPVWWMWLFYITIVFALAYLFFYPGLGSYGGYFKWSSQGQYQDEQKEAAATFGPIIDKYLKQDIQQVAANPEAREIGHRLFLNYCAQCHGSDAGGSRGYPSLRDSDWLYGGSPENIRASIESGRNGAMPALGAALGGAEEVRDVVHYVLSLSGRTHDNLRAQRGKGKFATVCVACHGADGKGNQQIGAPNLSDDIWLHGGTEAAITDTIMKGRNNQMPAHKGFLDAGKIQLLTAYVYGLSAQPAKK